jgi:hypothetical protein
MIPKPKKNQQGNVVGDFYPFGDCTPEKKQVISSKQLSFGIIATFEEVEV